MLEDRDLFAVRCHDCNAIVGVFVRDEWPEELTRRLVTCCAACLVVEEAEQITREAAHA